MTNSEVELRKTLDFLGLAWEPSVMDHANSKNHSRTLSTAQVRAPLSQNAIGRWKTYKKYLDPLQSAVSDLYPDGWDGPYR